MKENENKEVEIEKTNEKVNINIEKNEIKDINNMKLDNDNLDIITN